MPIYAYSLTLRSEQPIRGLGTINDIEMLIKQFDLPTEERAEWIIANADVEDRDAERYSYIHDEGGPDQWVLTWYRFA